MSSRVLERLVSVFLFELNTHRGLLEPPHPAPRAPHKSRAPSPPCGRERLVERSRRFASQRSKRSSWRGGGCATSSSKPAKKTPKQGIDRPLMFSQLGQEKLGNTRQGFELKSRQKYTLRIRTY